MKTTLCIVDMQTTFAGTPKALEGTLNQIRLAKRRKSGIVVLELVNCGETVPEIHTALNNYDPRKVNFISKIGGDGSKEFIQAAEAKDMWLKRIRVCGVNTCACVMNTISGLQHQLPKSRLEVAWEAVNCGCKPGWCFNYQQRFRDMGVVVK